MKTFLHRFTIFSLPLVAGILLIELFLSMEAHTFNSKYDYIERNKDSIEVLALGSSHTKDALNPALMRTRTVNLAYVAQSLNLDSKLLIKMIEQLPKLKVVFIELSYHSLEYENEHDYWRNSLYYRYYRVTENARNKPSLNQYSIYLSNPAFYHTYIISELNPFTFHEEINEAGFAVKVLPDRFEKLNYDPILIERSKYPYLRNRHNNVSLETYQRNREVVTKMVELCERHDIEVILLSPPLYKTYLEEMIPEKSERRMAFERSLATAFPSVTIWDFEKLWASEPRHFRNDDHLNPYGASVFTKILDDSLQVNLTKWR